MSKTGNKTIAEQLVTAEDKNAARGVDAVSELAGQVAVKAMQTADAIDGSIDPHARAEETAALTVEKIEDRVIALCMGANGIFYEQELRQLGDNGHKYALDYDGWDSRDDGAQPTGEIVTVDRFQFLDNALVYGVCSTFEFQLGRKQQASAKLRAQIRRTIAHGERFGIDNSSEVSDLATKLERSVDQEAMLTVALNKAVECYHELTGRFYTSAADREQSQQAAAKRVAADPRLAKLGV